MLVRLTLVMGREPTPAARAVFQRVDRGKVLAGVSGDGLAVAGRAVVPQLGRVANRAARPLDVDVAAHLTRRGKEALARQGSSFGRIAGRRCHPLLFVSRDRLEMFFEMERKKDARPAQTPSYVPHGAGAPAPPGAGAPISPAWRLPLPAQSERSVPLPLTRVFAAVTRAVQRRNLAPFLRAKRDKH